MASAFFLECRDVFCKIGLDCVEDGQVNDFELADADLVAVPVTSLYDYGTTVAPSEVLHPRIPQPFLVLNPADADNQMATDGMTVDIIVNGASATVVVKVNEGIPVGFALVPRSMGVSIDGPAVVEKIQVAESVAA